jgi:hypothetical protein
MKRTYELRALVNIYFDHYKDAVDDFKMCLSISMEEENYHDKMRALESLGKCF